MVTYLSTSHMNHSCMPYQTIFSPEKEAKSIQDNSFERVQRQPALKCHDTSPWLQKGSGCPFVHNGENAAIVENNNRLSNAQVNYYKTPQGIVELNEEGISLAVDRRISLFFQQAILCYKMSAFVFSAHGADDQIGTSPKLKLESTSKKSTIHEREAAHSSTIPTLIAHAKDGSTPDGFVYLKGGSSHLQHNATIGMHECVNGADELIDGNGQDKKLRYKAVELLNSTASAENDPVQVTKLFINAFKEQAILTCRELEKKEKKTKKVDNRKLVLESYLKKIDKIQKAVEESDFFDNLLGVIINPDDKKEAILRQVIYMKRYDAIRLQEVAESRIGKLIKETKSELPKNKRSYLEYLLLKQFSTKQERQILEKLFSKTVAIFEDDYTHSGNPTSLKTFKTKIAKLEIEHQETLKKLLPVLRREFRELSCAEFSYRAGVFKDLRTRVHDWTQNKFVKNYQTTTGYRISQSWVSRMEQLSRLPTKLHYQTPVTQRRKYVTLEEAKRCSKTFGVDPGVFLPCFFTSDSEY